MVAKSWTNALKKINISEDTKRVIDLFHLPPCRSSLKLHAGRSKDIVKIWRQIDQKIIVYENPQQHGWNQDYLLEWLKEISPTDMAKHLDTSDVECDYDTDTECDYDSDVEHGYECGQKHKRLKQVEDIK